MSSGAGPANLIFPSGVDSFSTKVDRNVVISGESHTIPNDPGPYTLFLDYVPLQENPSSVTIPGFTEVSGTPSTFQFNVTYSGVSAGELTFNQFQSGVGISVTYTSYGDVLSAEFINSLQSGLVAVETYVLANVASGDFVHTSGGTMTGPLVMNADLEMGTGQIIPLISGSNDIGTDGTPFAVIYADEIQTNYVHSASPLLIEAVGDVLTLSGTSIVAQGSIIPDPSGTLDLGSTTSAWRRIYVDELSSNVNLASGVNVVVLVSGSNSIGTAAAPLGTLWVDNLFAPSFPVGLSGAFVQKTGDTMTGSLTIASGAGLNTYIINNSLGELTLSASTLIQLTTDFLPTASGTQDLGSAALPFDTLYVKNIAGDVLSGNFVHITGDTMTGDLELPVGTQLKVFQISPASISGTINLNASQFNVDASSNIKFSTLSSQKFEIGLVDNYTSANILPTTSGITLGDALNVYEAVYARNFYYLDAVSGASFFDPNFSGTITLGSGATILPTISGAVNLGAPGLSLGTIYADTIITSTTSGTYVSKFGDSMTGTLLMLSGANITTGQSGINTIGTPSEPFEAVYADNIEQNFVHRSGDTMTGPLGLPTLYGTTGTLSISGNTVDILGEQVNVTSFVGPVIIDANTELQLLQNGNPGFVIAPSGITDYLDILPDISGTHSLGSLERPFAAIYADSVIATSTTSGTFVSKFGDSMTGDLTMVGANIKPSVSGANSLGTAALPWGTLYADSIIFSSGSSGAFVHISGDTMTGDLNINANLGVSGNINQGLDNVIDSIATLSSVFGWLNEVNGTGSSAFGIQTQAFGDASFAAGVNTKASGTGSFATGSNTVAIGNYSHVEGTGSRAHSNFSHAEGNGSIASGTYSHAEGASTTFANYSHAEGLLTIAHSDASHAEGQSSEAIGTASHAEGLGTFASGSAAHAEGQSTSALATTAHAEGNGSTASGDMSHAEGLSTLAAGFASHAQGQTSVASGNTSFAAGAGAIAIDNFTTAIGHGITAQASGSWVLADGRYLLNTVNNTANSLLFRFENGLVLSSGTNLTNDSSGVNTLGTPSNPFSAIYTNTLFELAPSGSPYVLKAGDTMTGSLTMASGADIVGNENFTITNALSNQSITINPSSGTTINGSAGNLILNGGAQDVLINGGAGQIFLNGGGGGVNINGAGSQVGISGNGLDIISTSGPINIYEASSTQLGISGNGNILIQQNASANITVDGGTGSGQVFILNRGAGDITISGTSVAGGRKVRIYAGSASGNIIETSGNIAPVASGTNDIGSLALPYQSVYAKTGYFTNISGMSPINLQTDLLPVTSGTLNLGSASLPFNSVNTNVLNVLEVSGVNARGYAYAYDTTNQTVAVANTFQDITFDTNILLDGWTHTVSTANFTGTVAGVYQVCYTATVNRVSTPSVTMELRAAKNGTEIAGSQSVVTLVANSVPQELSNTFLVSVSPGDVLKIQETANTTDGQIGSFGANATTRPSIRLTIIKL